MVTVGLTVCVDIILIEYEIVSMIVYHCVSFLRLSPLSEPCVIKTIRGMFIPVSVVNIGRCQSIIDILRLFTPILLQKPHYFRQQLLSIDFIGSDSIYEIQFFHW